MIDKISFFEKAIARYERQIEARLEKGPAFLAYPNKEAYEYIHEYIAHFKKCLCTDSQYSVLKSVHDLCVCIYTLLRKYNVRFYLSDLIFYETIRTYLEANSVEQERVNKTEEDTEDDEIPDIFEEPILSSDPSVITDLYYKHAKLHKLVFDLDWEIKDRNEWVPLVEEHAVESGVDVTKLLECSTISEAIWYAARLKQAYHKQLMYLTCISVYTEEELAYPGLGFDDECLSHTRKRRDPVYILRLEMHKMLLWDFTVDPVMDCLILVENGCDIVITMHTPTTAIYKRDVY